MSTAIVWHRRDLRVHDNPALSVAHHEYTTVVPVFVLDAQLLRGRFASTPRVDFMLGCLRALDQELRERGSGLVVERGRPEVVLVELARRLQAEAVLWTSDVAPYAQARDRRVREALQAAGVRPRPHGGNYVIDVSRPRTGAGRPFSVFSPFHRAWQQAERRDAHPAPHTFAPLPSAVQPGVAVASAAQLGLTGPQVPEPVVAPGEPAARAAAQRWLADGIDAYGDGHNALGRPGTSVLSPYLRWGCLSPRELEQRAAARESPGAEAWVRQLAWRDFYAHVLLAWPQNARAEFQPARRELEWEAPGERLAAWQRGETGYPLVDAGMRQLARTGWMHNRARLVVGSFLTKDLHIDWREGECWFERLLLDGEPAQNNGNWQWIASVGTDPAPVWRRMYNPTRQGRQFDPDGAYVRRWVAELREVPDERVHEPWRMSAAQQRACGCIIGRDYPAPIVDHQHERRRALARYGAANGERT